MKEIITIKKVQEKYNEVLIAKAQLKGMAYDYVKNILKGCDMEALDVSDQDLRVPYDGGKHSDDDGNPFSYVERVYIDGERDVRLETEDCEDLEFESLDGCQMADVAAAAAREVGQLPAED